MAGTPGMSLLYAGMDASSAGEVVAALDQRGVTYEVRGDSIYVDDAKRDSLRMTLAAEGLPANGGTGYELLDGFLVSAPRRRCSMPPIGAPKKANWPARFWPTRKSGRRGCILHRPQRSRFAVTSTPDSQRHCDHQVRAIFRAQADALRHLIAAAVPGMTPEEVAVIDSVGGFDPVGCG